MGSEVSCLPMDSRTKFYGPVLAMLALSAVSFSGFVTPPIESEESEERQSEERQEDILPASESPESEMDERSESPPVSDREAPDAEESSDAPISSEPAPDDRPPEPVSFLDWLFIPIPEELPSPSPPTAPPQRNVAE